MKLNLKSLIGHLTDTARRSLESAAGLCLSRTHYEIEVEHWLLRMLELEQGDAVRILSQYDIHRDTLWQALDRILGSFKSGNGRTPAMAPEVELLMREAWLHVSINTREQRVRTGVLLFAALADEQIGRRLRLACPELERIPTDALASELAQIVAKSPESREVTTDPEAAAARGEPGDGAAAST
ncbi:MAG: type VI secretion system ATPase TssH, partial [Planctomycetes bacterium]|nr:type VI secretion system ATPase TssH [Planctomycetota bacterium]